MVWKAQPLSIRSLLSSTRKLQTGESLLSSSGTEGTVALEREKEASQADFKVVWIEKGSNEEAETSWSTPLGDLSFGPVEVKVEGESANEPRS